MQICPRCAHRRDPADTATHPGVCPACGIAYAKWRQPSATPPEEPCSQADDHKEAESLGARLLTQLAELPEPSSAAFVPARALLFAVLALWTAWFAWHGIDWEVIGGSFLHRANLAFHEFGHVAFRPFGEFMTILGGSLFQLLLPLALALYFAIRQRDNTAAAVALWWYGQNFVDLAPYIRDAEYRLLPLVGGNGEEAHDWGNLLTTLDSVQNCYAFAQVAFVTGLLVMTLALGWGGWLLWRLHRQAS
jgi:hypothetical protein